MAALTVTFQCTTTGCVNAATPWVFTVLEVQPGVVDMPQPLCTSCLSQPHIVSLTGATGIGDLGVKVKL